MLILVRGVPGSGKSTWARSQAYKPNDCAYVFDADTYFVRMDGVYDFNPKLLKNAHEWCYKRVIQEIMSGETVYVANTFTRIWEMQRYIDFAKEFNIPFKVVRCTGHYDNIHGVPEAKVQQMLDRFEDYEGEEFV